ncbi:HTH domain-containing protein [Candidatus Pacearchaeota archaeon]|nr:HTH domain-containing protein [Candidatus Pacearchaeota archaeon]
MAEKSKTREITIIDEGGTFSSFFRRFAGEKEYDFGSLAMLRKLLSNEKARLLHFLKTKKPKSIYALAKMLKRDFKSVNDDIKLLEKFGFVDLVAEKSGNRKRLRPILIINSLYINLKI